MVYLINKQNIVTILVISQELDHFSKKKVQRDKCIRDKTKNLLQIFCEFMINSQVIFKSMKGEDDACKGDLQV